MQSNELGFDASAVAARAESLGHTAHLVQFYEGDAFLADVVAGFLAEGLQGGDAAVVLATAEHRNAIAERLHARGIDAAAARAQGRYVDLDAGCALAELLVDEWPDEQRFERLIGSALDRVSVPGGRVRAFGELVAILCADGRHEAAVRLEALWNGLASRRTFSLLCAYPLAVFGRDVDGTAFGRVCDEHAHVLPAESFAQLAGSPDQSRAITMLQQKASALVTATAACHAAEHALHAIIEGSPVPIVVMDPDTTVRFWNPAAERVFGWTSGEIVGLPLPVVPPKEFAEYASFWESIEPSFSVIGVETRGATRDGRLIDVVVSSAPLLTDDGVVASMVLLFEDVTIRKQAEIQRAELLAVSEGARRDAEASSRAKDEFLAMLGHELRNPLAAVRNAVAMARMDSTGRPRALEIAHRQIDQLARLVGDLLDVARITQRRIVLQRKRVSLAGIVERSVETMRPLVEERAHAITVTLPPDEIAIDGDATRLEQVVVNLLSNATKYTDPGGTIAVTVERDGDTAVLRVRDDGIGIPRELLSRVFDLFAQADRALDRAHGGLGIGLTVVKQLVELHGGTVEAHSRGIGTGSEFLVRLPALSALAAEPTSPPSPTDRHQVSVDVLLVEDNPDTAESLGMLLGLLGHRVRAAHDGPAAIDAATVDPPDVMLIDIGLPGMDGYEVARRIRHDPALARVVLIALTGYGRDSDKQQALAAGFDHHLVKPVDPDALHVLVARLSGGPARNGTRLH